MGTIAVFHKQRPGNYSICLSGQKIFSYHFCYKNFAKYSIQESRDRPTEAKVLRLFLAIAEQYASKEECIKGLNKVSTFLTFQGLKDDLKNSISKVRRPPKYTAKSNC